MTGATITGLSQGSAPYTERNLDRTIFDNFSMNLGKHAVRVGASFSQMLKTENASEGNANFQFNTWQNFLPGNFALYTQASRNVIADLHYNNFEAYAQDYWKIFPRLTLNLALRWSYFPSPTDVNDTLNHCDPALYSASEAPALDSSGNFLAGQAVTPATYVNDIIFPTGSACTAARAAAPGVSCSPFGARVNPNLNNNFAPRVFAFDPHGKGTMSLRGGFGIFYDRSPNGLWEQNAFSDPPLVQTATETNTPFYAPLERSVLSPVKLSPATTELHPEAARVFQDAYAVEFRRGCPRSIPNTDLHHGLRERTKEVMLELGRDFCFIGSEYPLQVGTRVSRWTYSFSIVASTAWSPWNLRGLGLSRNASASSASIWRLSIAMSASRTSSLLSAFYCARAKRIRSWSMR